MLCVMNKKLKFSEISFLICKMDLMSLNLMGYFKSKWEKYVNSVHSLTYYKTWSYPDLSHILFNPTSYPSTKQVDSGVKIYLWNDHFSTLSQILHYTNEPQMQVTPNYMVCIHSRFLYYSQWPFKNLIYNISPFKGLKLFLTLK